MTEAPAVGVVVLAAGGSSRMGEPKQLLRHGGRSLLARAIEAARGSRCRPVVVVLGASAEAARAEAEAAGANVALNPAWAEGMGGSIREGIAALDELTAGAARAAVVALCDQPFVTSEVLDRLVDAYLETGAPVVASEYGGTRGAPALFDRALFPELLALSGAEGAKRVVERHAAEAAVVAAPEAAVDVDTPEDFRALGEAEGGG